MSTTDTAESVGGTVARGVARERIDTLKSRIEPPVDDFKREAADRVEDVAAQIRSLGSRFDRPSEAHGMARRLERMADYLRYRPSSDVAGDAWDLTKRYKLLWIAGGAIAGAVLYSALRSRRDD